MHTRDLAVTATLALVLIGAATCRARDQNQPQGQKPPAAAPQQAAAVPTTGGTQTEQSGDLVCVAYCAPDQPGTPVAEIKWVVGAQPSASEIRRTAIQQNVDVAVNEDGFERNRFVRLPSMNPQARFAPAQPGAAAQPLPGLNNLSVRAVTSSQEPAGAMRLATPPEAGQENVVLQVQGLRPGLNYYWRVRGSTPAQTQVVMCRAPVCPSDRRSK
jgi:hypothetical protein